jgi:hypothetical protein
MSSPQPEAAITPRASDAGAFYDRRADGGVQSNRATIGPWSPALQHGGPPAALLGLKIEALGAARGARIARMTFDFLGPVPVADLTATAEVVRPGGRIQLSSAVLRTADRAVLQATAWHILAEPGRSTAVPHAFVAPPIPAEETTSSFPGVGPFPYAEALEWRFVAGSFHELGPATVWTRCRIPVLRGVPLTGLQRVLVMVDAANGISASLPITAWTFVPIDLTVVLERHPDEEWVGMAAVTTIGTDGIGFTDTTLFDARGLIGRALQTLFVAPRAAP